MKITRLFDLQDHIANNFPDKEDVFAGKENGEWVKVGIGAYRQKSEAIANYLIEKGIKPGDTIATISGNRPEWNLLDMAIMISGAVHVPIYPTVSESDYKYILNHAEVRMVFVEGTELLRKIEHILPQIDSIQGVFTFNDIDKYENVKALIQK
ncbi:MAG TPA: AMP-binding protein, partial [Bacteroidales bacterium]|nr:AMP-binding protein [Bacteroidales bacterium]